MSELFDDNINLVDIVINSVFPAYRHDDDIRQIALIALWTASEHYATAKASFPVYASTYIRNAVIDEIRKNSRKKRLKDACQLTEGIELEAPDLILEYINTDANLTPGSQLRQKDQQIIQMLVGENLIIGEIITTITEMSICCRLLAGTGRSGNPHNSNLFR